MRKTCGKGVYYLRPVGVERVAFLHSLLTLALLSVKNWHFSSTATTAIPRHYPQPNQPLVPLFEHYLYSVSTAPIMTELK